MHLPEFNIQLIFEDFRLPGVPFQQKKTGPSGGGISRSKAPGWIRASHQWGLEVEVRGRLIGWCCLQEIWILNWIYGAFWNTHVTSFNGSCCKCFFSEKMFVHLRCWISADVWLSGVFFDTFRIHLQYDWRLKIPFFGAILELQNHSNHMSRLGKRERSFFTLLSVGARKTRPGTRLSSRIRPRACCFYIFVLPFWTFVIIPPILSKLWEWWPWASMNGENLCIFTSIYPSFVRSVAWPFVFLRCQETFKKGVSQYAGNARETYCKLTGMTVQWVPGLSL